MGRQYHHPKLGIPCKAEASGYGFPILPLPTKEVPMELVYVVYLLQFSWMLVLILVGGFLVLTLSDVVKELWFKR